MSSVTVSSQNGRVSVPTLPLLDAPAQGDTLVGVQGGNVGRFDAGSFASSSALTSAQEALQASIDTEARARAAAIAAIPGPPDLSPYAKAADVDAGLAGQEKAWEAAVQAVRVAIPDVSGFATRQAMTEAVAAEAQARTQAIAAIPAPDFSGLATKQALQDEVTAREQAISAIPKPDLSGYATTEDLKQTIAALPAAPDVSRFVTSQQVANQITEAITIAGLARQDDLTAEAQARRQGDNNLADSINSLGASLDKLSAGSSGAGASNGAAASIIGYGYYNDGSGFVKKPIYQMFLTYRSSGGAGNQGTLTFPDGFEFLDVPNVSVQGCDLPAADFANNSAAYPIAGGLNDRPGWVSVTKNALVFNHPSGWPGWSTEVMTFVLTGFRKE